MYLLRLSVGALGGRAAREHPPARRGAHARGRKGLLEVRTLRVGQRVQVAWTGLGYCDDRAIPGGGVRFREGSLRFEQFYGPGAQ